MDVSQNANVKSKDKHQPSKLEFFRRKQHPHSISINSIVKFINIFRKQKYWPAIVTCVRNISADSTDLRGILADKIPKEQERVKNFRKAHGATKVGEVTVDMVSCSLSRMTMPYIGVRMMIQRLFASHANALFVLLSLDDRSPEIRAII